MAAVGGPAADVCCGGIRYRVVQPWGRDKARQAILLSEHLTLERAFAVIDRLAAEMARTGATSDAVELIVGNDRGEIMRRPEGQ